MLKWLIFAMLCVSSAVAAEPTQYSNITILPESGDRSGVSIDATTGTMLICEGPCYLHKMANSRVDKNTLYFSVNGHAYSATFTFNKVILNSPSPMSDPYFNMVLLHACINTRPIDVKCWPHEKFKMRNRIVL